MIKLTKHRYVNSDIDGISFMDSERKLHRIDGPAFIASGGAYREYWLNGKKYSFNKWIDTIPDGIVYFWRKIIRKQQAYEMQTNFRF